MDVTPPPTEPDDGEGGLELGNVGGSGDPIPVDNGPLIREASVVVNGKLDRDVVRRVVRQRFPALRRCYAVVLQKNPKLQGRVNVKLVIDEKGEAAQVSDGGSNIADNGVINCVTRQFSSMKWPKPESGVVAVVYNIDFAPRPTAAKK